MGRWIDLTVRLHFHMVQSCRVQHPRYLGVDVRSQPMSHVQFNSAYDRLAT